MALSIGDIARGYGITAPTLRKKINSNDEMKEMLKASGFTFSVDRAFLPSHIDIIEGFYGEMPFPTKPLPLK